MVVRQLQALLAGIYDVPLAHDVAQFLLTDRAALPGASPVTTSDEQLLVAEDADGIALGLFLDPQVLARLAAANPLESLNGANLADSWTALEGVSHFVYLAWNADHDRPVSLLELELQAEIDKYVSSWWLLRAQDPERYPAELHRLLFERCRIDEQLTGRQVDLYREANQHASRFCRRLERQLVAQGVPRQHETLCELRRFYRLSRERKMAHIQRSS